MPATFNDELEREDAASETTAVEEFSDEELPPDSEDEAEDLLELDANDQLRMLILESHALSVTATQVRNEFEMLHSRAFRLAAEWKLVSFKSHTKLLQMFRSLSCCRFRRLAQKLNKNLSDLPFKSNKM